MKTSYEYLRKVIDSCYLAWQEDKWSLVEANQKAKQQIRLCGWTVKEYDLYPFLR
jgi:hypothetical protein